MTAKKPQLLEHESRISFRKSVMATDRVIIIKHSVVLGKRGDNRGTYSSPSFSVSPSLIHFSLTSLTINVQTILAFLSSCDIHD